MNSAGRKSETFTTTFMQTGLNIGACHGRPKADVDTVGIFWRSARESPLFP